MLRAKPRFLTAVVCLASCTADQPPPTRTLQGRVVWLAAGGAKRRPAAHAEIALAGSRLRARADAAGAFRFRAIPGGSGSLRLSHDADGDGHVDFGLAIAALDSTPRDLGELVVCALAGVEGTVRLNGAAVGGARVTAGLLDATLTDDQGRYSMKGSSRPRPGPTSM